MSYYINQPQTSFFYWVGYKWIWIIRSVETNLGRGKLVEVVINIDAHLFFGFHRTDLSPSEYNDSLTLPHQVFTNHHGCSCYVLMRLLRFHYLFKNMIYKSLWPVATVLLSLKNTLKQFVWRGIHYSPSTSFCIIAIEKGIMSIQNVYRFDYQYIYFFKKMDIYFVFNTTSQSLP